MLMIFSLRDNQHVDSSKRAPSNGALFFMRLHVWKPNDEIPIKS